MKDNKTMWVGSDDFNKAEEVVERSGEEFYELPVLNDLSDEEQAGASSGDTNRRDFLKYMGFGLGAAVVAASCETPVRRALPYLESPDHIVPGVATYYASCFAKSGDFCPVLVKTREGRPIKIEGNKLSPMTGGGTSARAQAHVLELYDRARIKHPGKMNSEGKLEKMSWDQLDSELMSSLNANSSIRIVSHTNFSPTHAKAIEDFKKKYPNTELITYDAKSASALLDAQEQSVGQRVIPDYHFDKAETIVNFGADFLGSWISPVEYAADFAKNRKIKKVKGGTQSRMIAFETNMSLTGSNADNRVLIKPSERGLAIAKLHDAVATKTGGARVGASGSFSREKINNSIEHAAEDLIASSGKSIVLSDSNNYAEQLLINSLNEMLNNIGNTITYDSFSNQRKGDDSAVVDLIREMKTGTVDVLIFLDQANPAYDLPDSDEFAEAMKKVNLRISSSVLPNETLALCTHAAPTHHGLESWADYEPKNGKLYIAQPTIHPLFDTREEEVSLLKWSENVDKVETNETYYQYLRNNWKETAFPNQSGFQSFRSFWDQSVHNGMAEISNNGSESMSSQTDVSGLASKIGSPSKGGVELNFYESVNIGTGQYANNPWLQEMPDPLLRTVWDNFACVPVAWDGERYFKGFHGLESGDIVRISTGDTEFDITSVQAFGQTPNTMSVAMGYGRNISGKAGQNVGTNVFPMLSRDDDGYVRYYVSEVDASEKIGKDDEFASVQYHHTFGLKAEEESTGKIINADEKAVMTLAPGYQGGITDRTIIRDADLDHLKEEVEHLVHEKEHAKELNEETIYPGHEDQYKMGHKWGMNIDLSACIGCGACQVACIAENNVPIVGKREVSRHHEMTWLRIDRYYYGDSESPNVVYQPMMCQHCDNAPCENVCPVNATNHSTEGINQMAYNRCIGTRYCANNCPYKVRRFNWLDYTTADLFGVNENNPFGTEDDEVPFYADNLTRMVLNPDVTVRSRGVMEKCSFCVQRIQEGKLTAKKESRGLQDGDITPACASACPTGAITFGDTNDENSRISEELQNPMSYQVLMEINTRPAVTYKMKVVNRNEKITDPDSLS